MADTDVDSQAILPAQNSFSCLFPFRGGEGFLLRFVLVIKRVRSSSISCAVRDTEKKGRLYGNAGGGIVRWLLAYADNAGMDLVGTNAGAGRDTRLSGGHHHVSQRQTKVLDITTDELSESPITRCCL